MKKLLSILLVASCTFATAFAQETAEGTTTQEPTTTPPASTATSVTNQDFNCGSSVTIQADPLQYYMLTGWSANEDHTTPIQSTDTRFTIVAGSNQLTINELKADMVITALFDNIPVSVTYDINGDENLDHGVTVKEGEGTDAGAWKALDTYTMDIETIKGHYNIPECYSITGFNVYVYAIGEDNQFATDLTSVTVTENQFQITGNVVIKPIVEAVPYNVSIWTSDATKGSVSFVITTTNESNGGTTNEGNGETTGTESN